MPPQIEPEPRRAPGREAPRSFATTGPSGHRARMRARLLGAGAASLADYEILEMLLFLGIARRDTKPLAKGMINRYRSLAGVLQADRAAIEADFGLDAACLDLLELPRLAGLRLAAAERREAPTLSDWAQLDAYLRRRGAEAVPGQWRMLFLDNRNRLLADEAVAGDPASAPAGGGVARRAMARGLALHATALIGLRVDHAPARAVLDEAEAVSAELGRASSLLSLMLHDTMVGAGDQWVSLRRHGRLRVS